LIQKSYGSEYILDKVIESKKNTVLIVWFIPVLALLIAAWMIYQNYQSQGQKITIVFESADGLVKDKTRLKYKGVDVGRVTNIYFNENDLKDVNVEVTLLSKASDLIARESSMFWKVSAQVSLDGISGLGTIINGSYIDVLPKQFKEENIKKYKKQTRFRALNEPPIDKNGGIVISLISDEDTLGIGAPVLFNKYQIGSIQNKKLVDKKIVYKVLIYKDYTHLIKEKSSFYNVNSVDFTANLSGIKMSISKFNTILTGGVELVNLHDSPNLKESSDFKLHKTLDDLKLSARSIQLIADDGYNLIEDYSEVFYKGVKAGLVDDIEFDINTTKTYVTIKLEDEFMFLLDKNPFFWIVKPQIDVGKIEGLDALAKGSYISFDTGAQGVKYIDGRMLLHKNSFVKGSKKISLISDKSHSLVSGSPIYYKDIEVGNVYRVKLKDDFVEINAMIKHRYTHLINDSSQFFLKSPISIDASLSGIKIKSAPISAIIKGGIGFITNNKDVKSTQSKYDLLASEDEVDDNKLSIYISMKDSQGIKEGAKVVYRGIEIGHVESIELKQDAISLHVKIIDQYDHFINKQSLFWVEKFKLSLNGVENASALISPYIAIKPGIDAEFSSKFKMLDSAPAVSYAKEGLRVVVKSDRKSSLDVNSPLLYKQMQIGVIEDYYLSENSNHINMVVFIDPCYTYLIREDSQFYNASAIGFDISLSGIKVQTETVESMVSGALVVATPPNAKEKVDNMSIFYLSNEPDSTWLTWKPELKNEDILCESIF
jgi:paraquat-inducible protein B